MPPGGRQRGDDTTRPVVLWLCEHDRRPAEVRVHTANPAGREWLTGMARRYGPGVR
ncbi:cyclic-phosphate processing receiver domain-containing protein [Amycolatopsis sp. CA-126428]|uniref:cyclic-phosphate processing receiver domain-containing protein n=1 Tax=Amycolatopsis sp. CA-126428 TaxID=2073158 RepID=UPI0013048F75|nr:cyclic-phosphate processing receiver domain-containing protein [Amycolatopsis sp. CA-126428]